MSMHYGLLFRLAGAYGEAEIDAMMRFVDGLQQEHFLLGPPQPVNEVDSSGRTRPEDRPIRTVGGFMIMYPPSADLDPKLDAEQLRDVERLVEKPGHTSVAWSPFASNWSLAGKKSVRFKQARFHRAYLVDF